MTDTLFFFILFFIFFSFPFSCVFFSSIVHYSVHRVTQIGVTVAVNWWFDMTFGKDYVFQQVCFNLRRVVSSKGEDKVDGDDSNGVVKCDANNNVRQVRIRETI